MIKIKKVLAIGLITFFFMSCAQVYYSPEAQYAADNHEIIAIMPPDVTIEARKKVDPEALDMQQQLESENIQKEMYSWLIQRRSRQRVYIDILDIETTNALLERAGYYEGEPLTPKEIAEILDVDALLHSNFSMSKPISEGAALALGVVFGTWAPTNNVSCHLEIHDWYSGRVIWSYNHEVGGSVGSTPALLVDNLMRHASKKVPYAARR